MRTPHLVRRSKSEAGGTFVFVAVSLIALLGVMALTIDLGLLYVARSEAQRAADSAALAGADIFYTSGCTTSGAGACESATVEAEASANASAAAGRNVVAGQAATISKVSFNDPTSNGTEPQITVTVQRTGIQTILAKIFGALPNTVTATATAEAYNPTGNSASTAVACVAPFLVPNCDPNNTSLGVNPTCPTNSTPQGYFINPGANPPSTATVEASAVGEQWNLHFGDATPSGAAIPSEWFLDAVNPSQGNSGSNLRAYISQCAPVTCGQYVAAVPGNKVGPVDQGVQARIDPSGLGQDTIVAMPGQTPPYQIYAGAGNALVQGGIVKTGAAISPLQSASVVTVAVYDGGVQGAGGTSTDPVFTGENANSFPTTTNAYGQTVYASGQQVVGWMQIFIEQASGGAVPAMILNVSTCGNATVTPPIVTSGGTFVPIRLIQHAN